MKSEVKQTIENFIAVSGKLSIKETKALITCVSSIESNGLMDKIEVIYPFGLGHKTGIIPVKVSK